MLPLTEESDHDDRNTERGVCLCKPIGNPGPGGPDPGGPHLRGGRSDIHRYRGGGPGGCELAGGAVGRRVRVCDGSAAGADWVAGNRCK